ncbi:MAG: hypothetical protein V3T27_04225 [Alphaproteobacteria bacterium]
MKKLVLVLLLFAASPSIAAAQTFCADRAEVLDRLAAEYGEHLTEVQEIEDYGLLEVLKSPTEGTWTVILTKSDGVSCVLATGDGLAVTRNGPETRAVSV